MSKLNKIMKLGRSVCDGFVIGLSINDVYDIQKEAQDILDENERLRNTIERISKDNEEVD